MTEMTANGRLICAAPDYHAVAVAMVERHDANARLFGFPRCGCEECTPFRPVIAKALGK